MRGSIQQVACLAPLCFGLLWESCQSEKGRIQFTFELVTIPNALFSTIFFGENRRSILVCLWRRMQTNNLGLPRHCFRSLRQPRLALWVRLHLHEMRDFAHHTHDLWSAVNDCHLIHSPVYAVRLRALVCDRGPKNRGRQDERPRKHDNPSTTQHNQTDAKSAFCVSVMIRT